MKIILTILILLIFCPGAGAQVPLPAVDISKIITIESSGNPQAYNKKSGCIGLMQINPKGALIDFNEYLFGKGCVGACTPYNIGHLYTPAINIQIGTWYINTRIPQMLKHYKIKDTVEHRLIAYNFGVGNLRKYLKGEKKLPWETKKYIDTYNE